MEKQLDTKTIYSLIIILLILGAGYLFFSQYDAYKQPIPTEAPGDAMDETESVIVMNTPLVNGVLTIPKDFPQDIPVESESILESATTRYPGQNALLLSLSYESSQTIAQKYAEYKNYMQLAGYEITEEDINVLAKGIFGVKEDIKLSVVVSASGNETLETLETLVEIGYLKKL